MVLHGAMQIYVYIGSVYCDILCINIGLVTLHCVSFLSQDLVYIDIYTIIISYTNNAYL